MHLEEAKALVRDQEVIIREQLETFAKDHQFANHGLELQFTLTLVATNYRPVKNMTDSRRHELVTDVFTTEKFHQAGATNMTRIINGLESSCFFENRNAVNYKGHVQLNQVGQHWRNATMGEFMDAYNELSDPKKLRGVQFNLKTAHELYRFLAYHDYI